MKERLSEQTIALRAAKEFNDGDYINLGYGIPLLCTMFIPEGKEVTFQAENGVLGYGLPVLEEEWEKADFDMVDAGERPVKALPGMSFFDMDTSFDMIRGKHLDITVLGALEISERGDLANWTWGPVAAGGIGGSMDLAVGAKRVIVTMTHITKEGKPKIVKECKLPLTAKECIDLIITDVAVIKVTTSGLLLKEITPGWTPEEVQAITEPKLAISKDLKEIEL